MDFNSNMNPNLNGSGNFSFLPQQQNMMGTNFTPEQLVALQQMQLNAQMGSLTLNNGAQPNLYANPTSPTTSMPFPMMPNLFPSPGFAPGVLPSPTSPMPNLPLPQSSMDGMGLQPGLQGQSMINPDNVALYLQLYKNIPSAVDLRKTVKQELFTEDKDEPERPLTPPVFPTFNGSAPNTPNLSVGRQMFHSETNSTISSGPASPVITYSSTSDYSPGPSSPKSPALVRHLSEPKPVTTPKPPPTRGSSLKYDKQYPQDQCYRCMKKVYPMEKIGPVKDVCYHKGCFTCRTCGTKLNLKNFCHNKNDDLDIHIYCKSHSDQGTPPPVQLDANSVLIKGALSVPKLNKVNEQIRGNEETHRGGKMDTDAINIRSGIKSPDKRLTNNGRYHLDLQSLEIAHAINVPATDLQTGNKIKNQAWTRTERKSESVPPPDVVKYSDVVPEYDMESYNKIQVENNPDYDR